MYNYISREKIWLAIVGLTICIFAFTSKYSSICIVLLCIHWFCDKNFVQKIKTFKVDSFVLSCFILFGIHLLGLYFTKNPADAQHCVESKLSFIILPLLFSTENYINKKNFNTIMYLFSFACVFALCYSAYVSYIHNHQLGASIVFNRMYISEAVMHPGYWSNFFLVNFIWSSLFLFQHKLAFNKATLLHLFLLVFNLIALLLLVSKTAILALLLFFIYILFIFLKKCILSSYLYITFILISLASLYLFSTIPTIHTRIIETRKEFQHIDTSIKFSESTKSRLVAWKLEVELIKEKPIFGYGTGNAYNLLQNKFIEGNYTDLAKNKMHTHNQLLHFMIEFGLIGLFSVIYFFYTAIKKSISNKLLLWIWILFFINQLTDDMMEIQACVVFFMFIGTLLLYKKSENNTIATSS
jgi:O-antigen ligase